MSEDLINTMKKIIADLALALKEAEAQHKELIQQKKIIENMITSSGGFLWRKDKDFRYVYCDSFFCTRFLRLKENCDIVGFTDKALVLDFFRRTGVKFYMDKVSDITDTHCLFMKKRCRYFLLDKIDSETVLLDVSKTPIFSNDKFDGIVGFAIEKTNICNDLLLRVKDLMQKNLAISLLTEKGYAAYYLLDQNQECLMDLP